MNTACQDSDGYPPHARSACREWYTHPYPYYYHYYQHYDQHYDQLKHVPSAQSPERPLGVTACRVS